MSDEPVQSNADESSTGTTATPTASPSAAITEPRPPLITVFPLLKNTRGHRGRKPWDELFATDVFRSPPVIADKKKAPGWSPALFENDRRTKGGVESVTALVLDYDAKLTSTTVEEAATVWGAYDGAIHTTWSSTAEKPCFRVVLPFTRPMAPNEYAVIWEWARTEAAFVGQQIDPATKDASRLWFLPAVRPGAEADYRLLLLAGERLDPDRVLAVAAANAGQEEPVPPEPLCGEDDDVGSVPEAVVLGRAKKYLAKIAPAVEGQLGSRQTFKAALAMVRGFGLSEKETLALLLTEYNPRCQPPWDPADLARKVHDAAASSIPLGYLLKKRSVVRPTIRITTDQYDVVAQLEAVLSKVPDLYQRAGALVTANRPVAKLDELPPQIGELRPEYLGPLSTKYVRWVKLVEEDGAANEEPAHPPTWAIKGLWAMGTWPTIPPLEGVTEFPVLRSDGSVLENAGYDHGTGLLYLPTAAVPPVPAQPTLADAQQACTLLREAFCDFPFANGTGLAATLAGLLTPLVRYAYSGHAPLIVVDKNIRGSGGTLLIDVISTILTGRQMPRTAQAEDEAEERKRITTLLLAADPMVLIDNVGAGGLGSAALDALITGAVWKDRILGGNEQVALANRTTWFASDNNIVFRTDTARRCLRVRMASLLENPEAREDFLHPELLPWVKEHRGELLCAALTILRAFCVAGRPRTPLPQWGSFEAWSALVRAALVWCGETDPGLARGAADETIDTEKQTLIDLICGWREIDPNGEGMTIRDVLARFTEDALRAKDPTTGRGVRPLAYQRLRSLFMPGGRLLSAETISTKYMRRCKDRVWNGLAIGSRSDRTNTGVWFVQKVEATAAASPAPTDTTPAEESAAETVPAMPVGPQPYYAPESEAVRVVHDYADMLN